MSTLCPAYLPVNVGLSNYSSGPESAQVVQLTKEALGQLALQSHAQAVINDLYALKQEADEGGLLMSAATVEVSKRFLLAWPKFMPLPELAIDTDGEVMLDWIGPHRDMVSVSLRSDGRIAYAAHLGAWRTKHGTEAFSDAVPKTVLDAVSALYGS